MRRAALLLGVLLVVSLALSQAAGAQGTQSSAAMATMAAGTLPPPAYVLERDGTVINGGDVVTECNGFLTTRALGYEALRNEEEAQTVADKCRELGVPSNFQTGNSPVVLSLGTEGPPTPGAGTLPNTGGISLIELAGLATGVALIGGGLLLRRRRD